MLPARLLSVRVAALNPRPEHVCVWCPWCEEFHRHSTDDFGGVPDPKCRCSGSPFKEGGYILSDGSPPEYLSDLAKEGSPILPKYRDVLDEAAPELQAAFASALLGTKIEAGCWNGPVEVDGWQVFVNGREWQAHKREPVECHHGDDLISLAVFLYFTDQGVAAIRALEAVTGMRLGNKHCFAAWCIFTHYAEHGEYGE